MYVCIVAQKVPNYVKQQYARNFPRDVELTYNNMYAVFEQPLY